MPKERMTLSERRDIRKENKKIAREKLKELFDRHMISPKEAKKVKRFIRLATARKIQDINDKLKSYSDIYGSLDHLTSKTFVMFSDTPESLWMHGQKIEESAATSLKAEIWDDFDQVWKVVKIINAVIKVYEVGPIYQEIEIISPDRAIEIKEIIRKDPKQAIRIKKELERQLNLTSVRQQEKDEMIAERMIQKLDQMISL